jgi:hypothetical protein
VSNKEQFFQKTIESQVLLIDIQNDFSSKSIDYALKSFQIFKLETIEN